MKIIFMGFLWIVTILSCKFIAGDDAVIDSDYLPEEADIPALANGHVGFVIYGDSILMNGLYNGVRGESHRARIPNFANVVTSLNDCNGNNFCNYRLNMRQGYFQKTIKSINYGVPENSTNFDVVQKLYPHRFYNRAILNTFTLNRGDQTGNISVGLSLEPGNVASVDLEFLNSDSTTVNNVKFLMNCYETKEIEDIRYQNEPSKVCIGYSEPPAQLALLDGEQTKSYTHITLVANTAEEIVTELLAITADSAIFLKHTSVWEEHWDRFGISVEGNTEVNRVIYASIFYLISNLPSENSNQPNGQFYGLSPGGLPKGGVVYMHYQGHSFWDTEMWMYPPILLLNPKWSEDLLSYRYYARRAAADNARNTQYEGYRYPWESGFTGCEVTPDCCPEVVEYQHHIIADIAFAFRSHLSATRDMGWWKKYGCDVAFYTAKFWASRVKFNETTLLYDIRNVMGPDEDHHDIDNNVYTNVIAAINLYLGDFAGCHCKDVLNPHDYEKFEKIARRLTLLYDEEKDFHPQYEGYDGENIKQADAVLLGYPLQLPMKASTKRNDLVYYDNKTRENGPAMTWAMHTIGFLDLEDEATAARYFERSYALYNRQPFYVWSEVIPGQPGAGNFITGAGGFLQSVINGYGGVRLNFDDMTIGKSYLPKGTTKLTLNGIEYLNNVLKLEITQSSKMLRVVKSNQTHKIKVFVDGTDRGGLENFKDTYLTAPRDAIILLKPELHFGEIEKCEMKETIVGIPEPIIVPFDDTEWTLGSNSLPNLYELPTLSNGHVGFIIYGDSIFMNGLYNGMNGKSHRARIPNFSNIDVNLDCSEENCAYHLYLKEGYFQRVGMKGKFNKVTQEMYAHRYYNRLIINRIILDRQGGVNEESLLLSIDSGKEGSDDLKQTSFNEYAIGSNKIILRCYETIILEDPTYQKKLSPVCIGYTVAPNRLVLPVGMNRVEYVHFTAVGSTEAEVRKELSDVLSGLSYESVYNKHREVWENDMKKYEMTVVDNKQLNQILHSSLFYLISNLPSEQTNQPNGIFYGLSPSGLAKGSIDREYNGHSFWDTEMWMHPPILMLNPKWSEKLLEYRFHVRQAAEDYAKATNYSGYRFPWESAFTGREVCPEWAWEPIEFQHHITADIAFAFRSHLAATHDLEWWKNNGCGVALNTAKFWSSRVKFNETTKLYEIKKIMGPDEDHYDVDNNVYTNVIAAINLYLGDFAACVCKDLEMPGAENFAEIARSIKLLYDEKQDYHPQYEGYNGAEIKQADVVLVSYPLQLPMKDSTKRNNLLTYEKVTRETGPAMTWSMHTIGFLDIKDTANASKMFEKSYSVYNHEPFKTWSENQPGVEGAGNFITGIGGFLQSVINGYGGIRLHFDHLSITNFYNPPNTKGLNLKGLTYLNNHFNLEVKDDTATVVFTELSEQHLIEITLKPSNEAKEVKTNSPIIFKRDQELIMMPAANNFGECKMKETVLGESSAEKIKINLFITLLTTLAFALKSILS